MDNTAPRRRWALRQGTPAIRPAPRGAWRPGVPHWAVGRTAELALATRILQQRHLVGITGLAGSGKTTLIHMLMRQVGDPVVWMEVGPGLTDSGDALLWQLAQPLRVLDPPAWRASTRALERRDSLLLRTQLLLQALSRQMVPTTLWLDALQHATDPQMVSLIRYLCQYVLSTDHPQMRMVLSGIQLPPGTPEHTLPALSGLDRADVEAWAEHLDLALTPDHLAAIHAQSDGWPEVVMQVFTAFQRDGNPVGLETMVLRHEVRDLLIARIAPLSGPQRALLHELAAQEAAAVPHHMDQIAALHGLAQHHFVRYVTPTSVVVHPLIRHFLVHYGRGQA